MERRLRLQEELESILGSRNVYFQPTESVLLEYPCIIYSLSTASQVRADDKLYLYTPRYTVTVIQDDPDSEIYLEILEHFTHCSYDRRYVADNLYHDALTLYY